MIQAKPVRASRTEQIQILMPEHINGYRRLFGGRLVEWIDVVAAVAARRRFQKQSRPFAKGRLSFDIPCKH